MKGSQRNLEVPSKPNPDIGDVAPSVFKQLISSASFVSFDLNTVADS